VDKFALHDHRDRPGLFYVQEGPSPSIRKAPRSASTVQGVSGPSHPGEEAGGGMNRIAIALTLAFLLGSAPVQPAVAQGAPPALTEQEALAIAVDSYVYFYPLISMDDAQAAH